MVGSDLLVAEKHRSESSVRLRCIYLFLMDRHVHRGFTVAWRRRESGKYPRRSDDRGLLGMCQRHLDHFDAEEGRVRILLRSKIHTSRKLIRGPHAAGAGDVDVDVGRIFRIDEQAMRVRSAARLNIADVFWIADIADVEDANPAQSIFADRVLHTLSAAVDSRAKVLAGYE